MPRTAPGFDWRPFYDAMYEQIAETLDRPAAEVKMLLPQGELYDLYFEASRAR